MKKQNNLLRVGADGLLPGLRVIGHHGRPGQDQTPARRGAVLADAAGHIVDPRETRPARTTKGAPTGEREVVLERIGRVRPDSELPGIGTRIGPWPARLDHYVVILGDRELRRVDRIARAEAARSEPARMHEVLRWLAGSQARSEQLTCERLGGLIAWYCSEDEAFALWTRIQPVAREDLFAVRRSGNQEIINAAYWLTRAAMNDANIYLAVAAMRRAGCTDWRTALEGGVQRATEDQMQQGLEDAEEQLDRIPFSRTGGLDPALREQRRRPIDASFAAFPAPPPPRAA